ncbi:alpha-L-fucosidase [Flavobacterium rhamnosiphilum]|uniref:alpha-L-fucosidase n=1 Tax=Flavobacterium rhamnosiphilum TaxID=2541724 RepID=A0A4R5F8N8_9FLAO|nr:alpha-L-fucosidase [Flavobacterium rhamnosiphilum]TDE44816.1 alpha-L-fucosidase [Flavobacterium rhamnosiphilum]
MRKLLLSLLFSCTVTMALQAQTYTPTKENLEARAEFQDMKLGMFIHWGASSVLGNGEWVMNNRNIGVKEYGRLINIFNPQNFDAKKWVATAKAGGMKYITFITRHHDSFSNWDTKQSDWKITNTPYGKDALKQLADECHKEGIKLFCYYSLLDWYRSDYQYETGKTGKGTGRTQKSDWESYIRFMKAQLTELLTNYGKIDGIWFDGHWDQLDNDHDKALQSKVNWHYDEIYKLIHSLQPQCLISNNHHLTPLPGEDFQAFEKDLPGGNSTGFGGQSVSQLPLETCETMNDSWGFNITDKKYKSTKDLIHYMVNAASLNANFLLNVGPMPDGTIQPEFVDTLKEMGDWMKINGQSIYGTRGAVMKGQEWGVVTTKDKIWYAHIIKTPKQASYIFIPELKNKVVKCTLFNSKKTLKFKQQPEGVFVYLDGLQLDAIDTIIEIKLQ